MFTVQWIGGKLGDSNVREIVDTKEDALQTCEIYHYLDNTGELFEIAHIYDDDGVLVGVFAPDMEEDGLLEEESDGYA